MGGTPHILIVGAGYGGMHTALHLGRLLRTGEATVTVADPRSYMTYQPLLAEAAAGSLEPRHVVVPLRGVLRRAQVVKAAVISVDHARRVAYLGSGDGGGTPLSYDMLVLAPGSISRVLPIPGLAESGIGFKTIGEAIHLRNRVLARLDAAASAPPGQARRAALTFVFVGGGYAGVEALAELEDMARDACARYPEISRSEMRWVLVEAAARSCPRSVRPWAATRSGCCAAAESRSGSAPACCPRRAGTWSSTTAKSSTPGRSSRTAGVAPSPVVKPNNYQDAFLGVGEVVISGVDFAGGGIVMDGTVPPVDPVTPFWIRYAPEQIVWDGEQLYYDQQCPPKPSPRRLPGWTA